MEYSRQYLRDIIKNPISRAFYVFTIEWLWSWGCCVTNSNWGKIISERAFLFLFTNQQFPDISFKNSTSKRISPNCKYTTKFWLTERKIAFDNGCHMLNMYSSAHLNKSEYIKSMLWPWICSESMFLYSIKNKKSKKD